MIWSWILNNVLYTLSIVEVLISYTSFANVIADDGKIPTP